MNRNIKLLSAAILALSYGAANALAISSVQTSSGLFTSKTGVCTVDFNTPGSLTSCANATYSAADGASAHIVSGFSPSQYAQPLNDNTPYMTVGGNLSDPVTIALSVGANYFGFYAGSIDSYNAITFSSSTSSLTLSGDQINAFLGAGTANATQNAFFNIFTDSLFTTVSLSSSAAAFETDNHAFGIASPATVPEPGSIALLGVGLLAVAFRKHRRAV